MCYNPPEWLVDEMRTLDPNLYLWWDPGRGRWLVKTPTRRRTPWSPPQPPRDPTVLAVEDALGNFRPLDRRVLRELAAMDVTRRYPGYSRRGIVDTMVRDMDEREAAAEKSRRDEMGYVCRDIGRKMGRCKEIRDKANV